MSDKQKQLITVIRLFDLAQGIIGILFTLLFIMYTVIFGSLGFAVSTTNSNSGASFGIFLIVFFGGITLISAIFTGLNILLSVKLEEPKRWIWITQIIITCFQFLNLYYLPVNIYFLIQLLKDEYKEYYSE